MSTFHARGRQQESVGAFNKTHPLQTVLRRIREKASKAILPIVIFDLDDTIFSTQVSNLRIIQEFAADHADIFPDFGRAAARLLPGDLGWDPVAALRARGLSEHSPSIPAYRAYWAITFFTDPYAALDIPITGATSFVQACHKAGALIYYLSGRPIERMDVSVTFSGAGMAVTDHVQFGMELGTVRALTKRGFPFWSGRCEILLNKNRLQPIVEFKAEALVQVQSLHGEVIATFDNEPTNVAMFRKGLPDTAQNFWVATTWDPQDKQPTSEFLKITDFSMPQGAENF